MPKCHVVGGALAKQGEETHLFSQKLVYGTVNHFRPIYLISKGDMQATLVTMEEGFRVSHTQLL